MDKKVAVILISRFFQKELNTYDFEDFKAKIPSVFNITEKFDSTKYISMHLVAMHNVTTVRCGIIKVSDLIQFYEFIKPMTAIPDGKKILKMNFQSYPFLYDCNTVINNFEFVFPLNYMFENFKSYIKLLIQISKRIEKVSDSKRYNSEIKSFNYTMNFTDVYQG